MSERYINNLSGDFSICFSEHITGHPNKIHHIIYELYLHHKDKKKIFETAKYFTKKIIPLLSTSKCKISDKI